MTRRYNVLLVVLDSVRAESTSIHGYARETTPFLSEFADRATVYRQARAPGIHSIASHVSMFTGEHVAAHGAAHHTTHIDPTRTIWHEMAGEHGYATGLFTNNRIVSNASNLGDAFAFVGEPDYPLAERLENVFDGTILKRGYFRWYDLVARIQHTFGREDRSEGIDRDEDSEPGPLSERLDSLAKTLDIAGETTGYKTLHGGAFADDFFEWEARQSGPWAACLNLMDAHSPYEPEPEHDRWAEERHWQIQREHTPSVWETLRGEGWDRIRALEPLYDGAIRQVDAVIRDVVARLDERGLLSETVLIVTSDHGEAFGERSRLNEDVRLRGHKWGIHEVLTHVPLVISYPDDLGGRRVDEPVSLTELPALMRAAADGESGHDAVTAPEQILASTFRLPAEKRAKYASIDTIEGYLGPWEAMYEAHDGGVHKIARHGDRYVTVDIPGAGKANVRSRAADERLEAAFGRLADSGIVTEETVEIDEDLEQQLEDLGYIR